MTVLAILSDIHGNLPALEAVRRDLSRFKVDRVVVAGDVINWGPFSAQVMECVAREGWAAIRGNNEYYLLDYNTPRAPAEWNDRAHFPMLPWLHRQLNGRWHNAIAAWPDALSLRFPDAPPIRVTHGTPRSHIEPIYPTHADDEIAARLTGVDETTVIAGHTHLAMSRESGRWHIINPGSVGVPLDGKFGAMYALLEGHAEGWRPTFRRVDYDRAPVFEEFRRQRLIEECGVIGHLVVEEFMVARLRLHPFLHWRMAACPDAPFSIGLLDDFLKVDAWEYSPRAYHPDAIRPPDG